MKRLATMVMSGLLLTAGAAYAAPVTVQGTLVGSMCYLQHGYTTNDHGGMKDCGTMCLKSGVPGAVLSKDKTLHVIIAPSTALAGYVGLPVRVTGEEHGTSILPSKVQVEKDGKWMDVKLSPGM